MDKKRNQGWKVIERAKKNSKQNQQENLPIDGPTPNYLQISPEKQLDNLRNFLESAPEYINLEEIDKLQAAWPGPPYQISGVNPYLFATFLNATAVKIMRSPIFFNGSLKGDNILRQYPTTIYDSYPIQNLEQLIYELAFPLSIFEQEKSGYSLKDQADLFSKGIIFLDMFTANIHRYKGKQAAKKLETMLKRLITLEKEVSTKPDSTSGLTEKTVMRQVNLIFRKHIKAPKKIIADRVAELLGLFGIKRTGDAVRRKPSNKKQAS